MQSKESKHTMDELHQFQALPLSVKIRMTENRIRGWIDEFGEDGVHVGFSGGKDSTVLLDIARKNYPNVKAMFVDVPTQYPELKEFVKTFDNVDIVRPKISFAEVCKKYGFPLISKEVSGCVFGARKYLTSLIDEGIVDRQTDRQGKWHRDCFARVTGTGEYGRNRQRATFAINSGGATTPIFLRNISPVWDNARVQNS